MGLISVGEIAAPLVDLGKTLIERIFPDKEKQAQERAQAELALAQLAQDGVIKETQQQLSAIIAEAQSTDPLTSRARPFFLYVMYVMILASIPMGVLSAFKPDMAAAIAKGMQMWLEAIPSDLYMLFGVGYLGYTGMRSWDKKNGKTK